MILLDASVVIAYWKFHRDEFAAVLRREDIHVCGVTLAELMHGSRDQNDCARIEREIGRFIRLSIDDEDWASLGRNLFLLRTSGIRVPFQDALLATVAITHDMEFWTLDGHYTLIQQALPKLRLFSPEAGGVATGGSE
jgi:predicted nucleic acid-binding protein